MPVEECVLLCSGDIVTKKNRHSYQEESHHEALIAELRAASGRGAACRRGAGWKDAWLGSPSVGDG